MRSSSIGYLIKEGARSIYANRLMSLASIGVLMACLLLIGASILLTLNINGLVGYAESRNEVVAFLEDGTTAQQKEAIAGKLGAIENIAEFRFVSKEEGLQDWVAGLGDVEPGLFDVLYEDNVLPDSYSIKVLDLSIIDETVLRIEAIDGVESAAAPVQLAETITVIKRAVNAAGTAIVGILAVVAIVIVANTIKITVFNRRREISIMKFVGATDMFIRLPFVVEGLLLGMISALLAFFLLWGGYSSMGTLVAQNPAGWFQLVLDNMIDFSDVALQLFAAFMLAGSGIGMFGSIIYVRRYLKV